MSVLPLNSQFIKALQNKLNDNYSDYKICNINHEIFNDSTTKSFSCWQSAYKQSALRDPTHLIESGKLKKF